VPEDVLAVGVGAQLAQHEGAGEGNQAEAYQGVKLRVHHMSPTPLSQVQQRACE
jgi:hypothetical protein